jgi:hypothetical protein
MGNAVQKPAVDFLKDDSSAGELIAGRFGVTAEVSCQLVIRSWTFSRVAASIVACRKSTVIRSRAKSAGFVVLGH